MSLQTLLDEIKRLNVDIINHKGTTYCTIAGLKLQGIKESDEADSVLIDELLKEIRPRLLPVRIDNMLRVRQQINEELGMKK